MSSHLTTEVMNGYARRSLSPGDLLSVDDHLEACSSCRERISDDEGLREAIRSLQEALRPAADAAERHLAYEQIESHAEGILSRADREIVDAHLAACERCAAEAKDLAAFVRSARTSIGAGPAGEPAGREMRFSVAARRGSPEVEERAESRAVPQQAAPGAVPGEEEAVPEPGASRTFSGPAVLAMLTSGLVAAAAAAYLVPRALRRQVVDLTAQVESLRSENEALSEQSEQVQALRAELEDVRSEPAGSLPAGPEATAPGSGALSEAATAPGSGVPSEAISLVDRRGPVGLDANGDLIGLDALSVAAGRTIAAALRSGHAGTSEEVQDLLVALVSPGEQSAPGAVAMPIAPVATIVRDARPTFSWKALPGIARYTVALFDAESNAVARSESLARTSWRPSRPLQRGGVYFWLVLGRRAGEDLPPVDPSASQARFKVLGAKENTALERSLRDSGGSHLAAGVLLARAGCISEARREFQELLRRNPDSPLIRELLKGVTPEMEDTGGEAAGRGQADKRESGSGSTGPGR